MLRDRHVRMAAVAVLSVYGREEALGKPLKTSACSRRQSAASPKNGPLLASLAHETFRSSRSRSWSAVRRRCPLRL